MLYHIYNRFYKATIMFYHICTINIYKKKKKNNVAPHVLNLGWSFVGFVIFPPFSSVSNSYLN